MGCFQLVDVQGGVLPVLGRVGQPFDSHLKTIAMLSAFADPPR
jgi:hypothetical protein